jgi:hypothetical protein
MTTLVKMSQPSYPRLSDSRAQSIDIVVKRNADLLAAWKRLTTRETFTCRRGEGGGVLRIVNIKRFCGPSQMSYASQRGISSAH